MGDLIFVVRVFLFTTVLVVLMQIKIGDETVEDYAQDWIRHSRFVESLREVAQGAVNFVSRTYDGALEVSKSDTDTSAEQEQKAGIHSLGWRLERSDAYKREQEQKRER